jgi:hypothetical protein
VALRLHGLFAVGAQQRAMPVIGFLGLQPANVSFAAITGEPDGWNKLFP